MHAYLAFFFALKLTCQTNKLENINASYVLFKGLVEAFEQKINFKIHYKIADKKVKNFTFHSEIILSENVFKGTLPAL
jgi:hypothetical protein